jgi:hypothetical protein
MSFQFRPGVRENVGLLIGLIGPSGGGKTYTAMELAAGISGGKPFAVIDTEARRALHYADRFRFDHGDLKAPFRPDSYVDAIVAADKAGYPVIIVDNVSHVWYGDGGLLEWQEEEHKRLGGNDKTKMLAWVKPKMAHKKMVQKLLQVRAHLILCFRAEEKTKMLKNDKGKLVPTNIGWQPICEKNLPYELTASLLLVPENPGVPIPIKLQEQHRALFPPDHQITRKSGDAIRDWAKGGEPATFAEVNELIKAADTIEALKQIGVELTRKRLSPEDTIAARGVFKARREALAAKDRPAESPESESDGNGVPDDDEPIDLPVCASPDCGEPNGDGSIYCVDHRPAS